MDKVLMGIFLSTIFWLNLIMFSYGDAKELDEGVACLELMESKND